MHRIILLAALAAGLCACDKPKVDVHNATPEEVAREVAKAGASIEIKPGKWEYTTTLLDMSSPGMPPAAVERMKKMMATSKVTDRCLTPDDVKKLDAAIADSPRNCRFEHYTMANGKIDGAMHCTNPRGSQDMTIKGSYAADATDVTATNKMSGNTGPMGDMSMTMNVKGKWVGACEPDAK